MNLKSIPTAELNRELERRELSAEALLRKRDKLLKELEKIDSELDVSGGGDKSSALRPKRSRARNDMSLGDALAQSMEVRAVISPAEASQLVKANGYKTTSKNFNMMVSNTLAKDLRFKRVSRGQYERIG
jgi:hypothetical protein